MLCTILLALSAAVATPTRLSPAHPVPRSPDTQEQTANNPQGTESSPLFVKVLAAPKTAEETADDRQTRHDQSSANWWMVKLTAAVFFVGVIQAIVFGLQARRLKETIKKMDQIAGGQTKDTRDAITQAARSAGAVEQVAAGLQERARQELRAYICVVVGEAIFQERTKNLRFSTHPFMINKGATPAHNVRYRAAAEIRPVPLPADFTFPLPQRDSGPMVVGPDQSIQMGALVENEVPDEQVEQIKSGLGGRGLYTWGVITYDDVFGGKHETEFAIHVIWLHDARNYGWFQSGHNRAT
ncbi:MAG: hypothetical protein ABR961_06280 [Thermoanaerobaculaceae bacterium]|jgi:hypothetical protein